jgi:hypothetical protein
LGNLCYSLPLKGWKAVWTGPGPPNTQILEQIKAGRQMKEMLWNNIVSLISTDKESPQGAWGDPRLTRLSYFSEVAGTGNLFTLHRLVCKSWKNVFFWPMMCVGVWCIGEVILIVWGAWYILCLEKFAFLGLSVGDSTGRPQLRTFSGSLPLQHYLCIKWRRKSKNTYWKSKPFLCPGIWETENVITILWKRKN